MEGATEKRIDGKGIARRIEAAVASARVAQKAWAVARSWVGTEAEMPVTASIWSPRA